MNREAKNQPELKPRGRQHWGLFSPLMRRILAVNMIALGILGGGILYLNQFRESLIERRIEDLRVEAQIIAGALGESASLGPESRTIEFVPARQIIDRLVGPTKTRARLFAPGGQLILDSRYLDPSRSILVLPLPAPDEPEPWHVRVGHWVNDFLNAFSAERNLPPYVERPRQQAADYPEVVSALKGETEVRRRALEEGITIITAAAPVQRFRRVLGALMLSTDTREIQAIVNEERLTILKIFGISLAITLLLSIFLAGTIARPIHRLASAADEVKKGIGRADSLKRFSGRRDEVGALSRSLSEMTEALHRQINAVESFAADVAHEMKNPLSSLRSAVETLQRTSDKEVRRKLLRIIDEDVRRLDRLITDISDASKLDAELSRSQMEEVDFGELVKAIAETYSATRKAGRAEITFNPPKPGRIVIRGIEGRLGQVVYNLLDNALSFTPASGKIQISLAKKKGYAELVVDDNGPGLALGAEEKIFSRFYSERPKKEAFGTHSGLGLSISRQIVEAHGGTIRAENRLEKSKKKDKPKVLGARFVVRLPA